MSVLLHWSLDWLEKSSLYSGAPSLVPGSMREGRRALGLWPSPRLQPIAIPVLTPRSTQPSAQAAGPAACILHGLPEPPLAAPSLIQTPALWLQIVLLKGVVAPKAFRGRLRPSALL